MSQNATTHDLQLLGDRLEASFKGAIQDLIVHFNKSQGVQNKHLDHIDERLDGVDQRLVRIDHRLDHLEGDMQALRHQYVDIDTKLGSIVGMLATRKELRSLIRELKAKGVPVDETQVLIT